MPSYQAFIKQTLDRYKCRSLYDPLISLPVYTQEWKIRGFLRPITADFRATTPHYASLLGQWRRENPIVSPGSFEITDARTEVWLDRAVIGRDDRILFMLENLAGLPVGHLGYSAFTYPDKHCEIDYVLRGVKNVSAGIMTQAMNAILRWGVKELKLKRITLKTYTDNEESLCFYKNCGFSAGRQIPLYQKRLPGELRWEEIPKGSKEKPGRYYTEMVFDMKYLDALKRSEPKPAKKTNA